MSLVDETMRNGLSGPLMPPPPGPPGVMGLVAMGRAGVPGTVGRTGGFLPRRERDSADMVALNFLADARMLVVAERGVVDLGIF